jgi:hypothetical protein
MTSTRLRPFGQLLLYAPQSAEPEDEVFSGGDDFESLDALSELLVSLEELESLPAFELRA